MLFNEFGDKNNPAVLCMHGMMQRWESEYELLKPLEEHYRLIIPAVAICLIVLSLNLLGDGLRDAFDPKLKK